MTPAKGDQRAVEKWRTRDLVARYYNEPIYVSPEEMQELRDMEAARQREETHRYVPFFDTRTTYAAFAGTPVVVDPERADEQRVKATQIPRDGAS